jgi:hypothetical protein
MGILNLEKFNLNRFWEKTPTPLKYILIISIIIGITYFFITKKVYNGQLEELKKTEQGIIMTYDLIQRFEKYKYLQNQYNIEYCRQLRSIYTLISELKDNTDEKLNVILKSGSKNKEDIVDKLELLNKSFEKISKAYKPSIENENIKEDNLDNFKINGYKKE